MSPRFLEVPLLVFDGYSSEVGEQAYPSVKIAETIVEEAWACPSSDPYEKR
jgi:hypothetical protein